nr:hypothetical protein [Bacillus piscicola]
MAANVNRFFELLFKHQRLNWYLDTKEQDGAEIVIAELKGMSRWNSEGEVLEHLERAAPADFWKLLQGYQIQVFPVVMKGCCKHGDS